MVERLYKNLCESVYRVQERILGEDYYNMGMDVYTTHDIMCDDIIRQYKKVEKSSTMWRSFAIVFGCYGLGLTILVALELLF